MTRRVNAAELLIRQRLTALRRALPHARAGDIAGIHEARVATRRLREALPLVARGARARKLTRTVRRLTRALGPVRELDVALTTLEELAGEREVPRGGVRALQHLIRSERQALHRDVVRALDRPDLDKLTRKAVAAARAHDANHTPRRRGEPARLDAARRRAARRAETLRAAIDNAAGLYLPDRLHAVRIAVKKLRYAMEIARELSGSRATARILALKRVQDLLGRMHDLEVLIARTRAVQASPNAPSLRTSSELDRLVRRLETECRQLHGQYMVLRPALLGICDYAVAAADARVRAA
jgi:CHAD domain-containing protein